LSSEKQKGAAIAAPLPIPTLLILSDGGNSQAFAKCFGMYEFGPLGA
jgi:hypothetical protein